MTMRSLIILIYLSLLTQYGQAQVFLFSSNKRTDTTLWKIKNKSNNFIFGNSTYIALALNLATTNEFEFSLGRTKGIVTDYGRGISYTSATSWGFSYAHLLNQTKDKHVGKFFVEYSYFPTLLLGNFVVRVDYSYNFSNGQQYIRPALGLTLVYLDILYNYSFKLNGNNLDNIYRHGLIIRPKLILKRNKWERNYFIKNRNIN